MIHLNSFVRDHRGGKSEIPVTFRRTQGLTKKETKQENTSESEASSKFVYRVSQLPLIHFAILGRIFNLSYPSFAKRGKNIKIKTSNQAVI